VQTNGHQQLEGKPIEVGLFTGLSPKHEGSQNTAASLRFIHSLTMWRPNRAMAKGITAINRMKIGITDQNISAGRLSPRPKVPAENQEGVPELLEHQDARTKNSGAQEAHITLCSAGVSS